MPELTVVIPVAGYHKAIAERAIASVEAQTIPCALVVFVDDQKRGAGFARNRGLDSVQTPFVTFLDADDVIAPKFAETCLLVEQLARRDKPQYIYTNWIDQERVRVAAAPLDMWQRVAYAAKPMGIPDAELENEQGIWYHRTWHPVTTLIPTASARTIGGFDEVMEGLEDKDFYVRLTLSGVCGVHLNVPLFEYMAGGQRSVSVRQSGKEALINQYILNRYKDYNLMGCCGDNHPTNTQPGNAPEPGDVLARAIYLGNRRERGLISGRLYHITGNGKLLYMDARDIDAAPHMWKREVSAQQINGVVLQPQYQSQSNWQNVAGAIFGGGQVAQTASSPIEYKPLVNQRTQSDVLNLVKGGK